VFFFSSDKDNALSKLLIWTSVKQLIYCQNRWY